MEERRIVRFEGKYVVVEFIVDRFGVHVRWGGNMTKVDAELDGTLIVRKGTCGRKLTEIKVRLYYNSYTNRGYQGALEIVEALEKLDVLDTDETKALDKLYGKGVRVHLDEWDAVAHNLINTRNWRIIDAQPASPC